MDTSGGSCSGRCKSGIYEIFNTRHVSYFCLNNAKTMELQTGDLPCLDRSLVAFTKPVQCPNLLRLLLLTPLVSNLLKLFLARPLHRQVHAFVCSRIDYCNSQLLGLPKTRLSPLQTVLNAAARLVARLPRYSHISYYIKEHLHWLPISTRIEYKVLLIVLKAQMGGHGT